MLPELASNLHLCSCHRSCAQIQASQHWTQSHGTSNELASPLPYGMQKAVTLRTSQPPCSVLRGLSLMLRDLEAPAFPNSPTVAPALGMRASLLLPLCAQLRLLVPQPPSCLANEGLGTHVLALFLICSVSSSSETMIFSSKTVMNC